MIEQRLWRLWVFGAVLGLIFSIVAVKVWAADCPPGAKSCKVLTITPDEEQALMQPNGVLETAERARYLDLSAVVNYFRQKLSNAPAGEVKPLPEPAKPSQ